MPSEQIVPTFALRGYAGKPTRVAVLKYFEAKQVGGFIDQHVADMKRRNWPVAKQYVERDIVALEELANASDAVLVIPSR